MSGHLHHRVNSLDRGDLSLCHHGNTHHSVDDPWGFNRLLHSLDHGSLSWHRGHIRDLVNALGLLHVRLLQSLSGGHLVLQHNWHVNSLFEGPLSNSLCGQHHCFNGLFWNWQHWQIDGPFNDTLQDVLLGCRPRHRNVDDLLHAVLLNSLWNDLHDIHDLLLNPRYWDIYGPVNVLSTVPCSVRTVGTGLRITTRTTSESSMSCACGMFTVF